MTGSQRHFEWLLDIIREVEEVDEKGLVSVDIFITQFFQQFDMRTAMLVRKIHVSLTVAMEYQFIYSSSSTKFFAIHIFLVSSIKLFFVIVHL